MRYPEEFVRHKMLDIVGDLLLLGRPIHGHLIAVKPSHAANCELVRRIATQMRKPMVATKAFTPPPAPRAQTDAPQAAEARSDGALDTRRVMEILPHRPPFLMVD